MLAEREKVEQVIMAIFGREGFMLRRVPQGHAGGKWRLGFVVYGACSRRDWRTESTDEIGCDHKGLRRQLIPVLHREEVPERDEMDHWIERLVVECRERLSLVLPFEDHEHEFLERVNEYGEIVPELLTGDSDLAGRISQHPQLLWKA